MNALPCAGALCEQVQAAGSRGPRKKAAFVKTVYASGSRRLPKKKTEMAAEKRAELLAD